MASKRKPRCPAWNTENGSPYAERKRRRVLRKLVREDYLKDPSPDLVKSWHKIMFEGIAPHPDYVEHFRDQEHTTECLRDYNVVVAGIRGTDSNFVLVEVDAFFDDFHDRLSHLESSFPAEAEADLSQEQVHEVVKLAAWAHGEWVRIHPFANGNGRTSRLLANYVLVKFGFGPALAVRPRPHQPYGIAARDSMMFGNHKRMEDFIWTALAESYFPHLE